MPLKIPGGWAVTYNHFLDKVPSTQEEMDLTLSFTEDILQIFQLSPQDGTYCISKNCLLIDLGWSPEWNINGTYRLTLVLKSERSVWEEITVIRSSDGMLIRETIERWLVQLLRVRVEEDSCSIENIKKLLI